jgi:hypothetical protein
VTTVGEQQFQNRVLNQLERIGKAVERVADALELIERENRRTKTDE